MDYSKHFNTTATPQSEPIPGKTQVVNSAGGYVFATDDFKRLERFLILGTEGGTYYASEQKLTRETAKAVEHAIQLDGVRVVNKIVEISEAGRAPKNEPAIFALAMALKLGDLETRRAARVAVPRVCRISTRLFHLANYIDQFGGWGRIASGALKDWYLGLTPEKLVYQGIKYQQRDGWSHRDLLRLSHPKPEDKDRGDVLRWMVKGWETTPLTAPGNHLNQIWAYERAKVASRKELIELIVDYKLPHEAIPTEAKTDPLVWEALLPSMGLTAVIRNLGNMTRIGLVAPLSEAAKTITALLTDEAGLHKAKIHPIALLMALKTYAQGHGERSSNSWEPVQSIVDALDKAFYKAFKNVEPTGKSWLLACDISGSMDGGSIAGCPGLTPRIAVGALALVTANIEANHHIIGFTSGGGGSYGGRWGGGGNGTTEIKISPRQRLDDVCRIMEALPMGGTDCALPMIYAEQRKLPVDVFVVLTDNETWEGDTHACQALASYRKKVNGNAKLAVLGMTATDFTIADPADAGTLDLVGFDAAVPQLLADFARG